MVQHSQRAWGKRCGDVGNSLRDPPPDWAREKRGRFAAFPLILGIVLCVLGPARAQDPLPLVTGEHPPYTGQAMPHAGLSNFLIKEVFRTANLPEPTFDWQPWQRGYALAKKGKYAGTYPYVRTDEREKDFLYSDPLHTFHRAFFTRKDFPKGIKGEWYNLKLCVPLGWGISYLEKTIKIFNLTMIRPASMELCLNMVERGRADLVSDDALAMVYQIKGLFGTADALVESEYGKQDNFFFFFIISRTWPNAEEVLKKFNAGLAALQASGEYDRLVEQYIKENVR